MADRKQQRTDLLLRTGGTITPAMLARIVLTVVFLALTPTAGWAAAGNWGRTDTVSARLVAAVDAVGDGAVVPLGLEIRLQPGWKTYWRFPGDAGLAPQLDWSGSSNLASATLAWPAPTRFRQFGLETFGYEKEVILPVTVRRADLQQPLTARAAVDLLVCHDICVPAHFDLTLALPLGPATPAAEAASIARSVQRVPGDGRAAGLALVAVRAAGDTGTPGLEIEATAREPFRAADLFVESTPPQVFAAPVISLDGDGRHLLARLAPAAAIGGETPAVSAPAVGSTVTITLVDGDRALEATTTVAPPAPAPALAPVNPLAAVAAGPTLPTALALALLGGLILNLMPCVLPVLSMKLLAVVRHGGSSPRIVRAGFLATAAGILTSFLVLAGVIIVLKAGGSAVGWGLQFQQPAFLAGMAVVVSLFACNLWDVFEIPLPRFIADAAARPDGHGHLAGPFVTGAFATLLATPCSAPFLGTAVGFALAHGPVEILAIFLALGVGLALPYLAVAAFPRVAIALPRPGRWMIGLRRLLGFVLAATALWLLWLLSGRTPAAAAVVAALTAGLTVTLAIRPRLPNRLRPVAVAAAVTMALAAIIAPRALEAPAIAAPSSPSSPVTTAGASPWQAFDLATARREVARGHVVFVDVTADWCLTCQANQRLVLDRPEVASRLFDASGAVVAMRADWTRPDPNITRYLAGFGRYGIPFNLIYGPGAPAGLVLPELLTASAVLDGLTQASGRRPPSGTGP
jgi:suppressor for copper-sensitivity B